MAATLVVAGFGACSAETEPGTKRVVIDIRHSAFDPDVLDVATGTTVTFVVKNTDPIDHEFILGDEEVQDVHEKGTEAHHDAKPGEISIPAGKVRRTVFTFTSADDLIFGCHLPGHYAYGMRGTVEVT